MCMIFGSLPLLFNLLGIEVLKIGAKLVQTLKSVVGVVVVERHPIEQQ